MLIDPEDAAGKSSVLVVDDEPEIREEVMEALADEGLTVFAAGSVNEALKKISDHRDIKVVITDLRMPGELGTEIVHEATKDDVHDICFILMTGHRSYDPGSPFNEEDFFSVLSKPVDIEELIDTIKLATKSTCPDPE